MSNSNYSMFSNSNIAEFGRMEQAAQLLGAARKRLSKSKAGDAWRTVKGAAGNAKGRAGEYANKVKEGYKAADKKALAKSAGLTAAKTAGVIGVAGGAGMYLNSRRKKRQGAIAAAQEAAMKEAKTLKGRGRKLKAQMVDRINKMRNK
jgi:hypothetical protein